jgi:hypothetical protein
MALLDVGTMLMSHDFEAGILQILPLCLKSGLVAVKAGLTSGEGFKIAVKLEIILPLPLLQLLL